LVIVKKLLVFSSIFAALLLSSSVAASAQMPSNIPSNIPGFDPSKMQGMPDISKIPGMPSMPKMGLAGKYTNAKWGLEVTIPKGYSGMEMSQGDSLSLMLTEGTGGSFGGDMSKAIIVSASKIKPNASPTDIPAEYKNKCKAPQLSSADINGKKFSVIVAECVIDGNNLVSKIYQVIVEGTNYAVIGMSSNGVPSSTLDDVAKTLVINKVTKSSDSDKKAKPSTNASPKATDKTKATGKKTPQPSAKASPKATDKTVATGKKTTSTAASAPVKDAVVEMAKGTATNTKCGDQCFVPNKVTISAGGTVTWKNVDSAGHFAAAADGKTFDTGMVNAGASSAPTTIKTAGTYDYMCMVHPWMKGTVVVQ
jgi:plastocyanin